MSVMSTPINVDDHYWFIGDSTDEVYQSKSNTKVPVSDPAFANWSSYRVPTRTTDDATLAATLRNYRTQLPAWLLATEPTFIQPTPTTYTVEQLKSYSADARRRKQSGGIVVNGIPFPTDTLTLSALNSAMLYTSDKQTNTFSWKLPDGTFITLDTQGIKDLQSAVSKFGQDCFACEDETAAAIDAGTITDLPAIDAAYAAVSNVVTGISSVARRKKK